MLINKTMEPSAPAPNRKTHLQINLKYLVLLLLLVIGVMLWLWRPWSADSERTIQVNGTATVKAEPDQFIFYPSYEFNQSDSSKAQAALVKKSNEISAGLKKLGVADSQIKSSASNYGDPVYLPVVNKNTYSFSLTITVTDKALAQKVQNYLLKTQPKGELTPFYTFSEAKRKQLESEARTAAEKDARQKAEQSGANVGFKLGKVKNISEQTGLGQPLPYLSAAEDKAAASSSQLSLQPGENELTYTVAVTYYIK